MLDPQHINKTVADSRDHGYGDEHVHAGHETKTVVDSHDRGHGDEHVHAGHETKTAAERAIHRFIIKKTNEIQMKAHVIWGGGIITTVAV